MFFDPTHLPLEDFLGCMVMVEMTGMKPNGSSENDTNLTKDKVP